MFGPPVVGRTPVQGELLQKKSYVKPLNHVFNIYFDGADRHFYDFLSEGSKHDCRMYLASDTLALVKP